MTQLYYNNTSSSRCQRILFLYLKKFWTILKFFIQIPVKNKSKRAPPVTTNYRKTDYSEKLLLSECYFFIPPKKDKAGSTPAVKSF